MKKELSNEKIVNNLIKILYVVVFIILLLIGTMSFIITAQMTFNYKIDTESIYFKIDNIFLNILLIAIFIACIMGCLKVAKKFSMKTITIFCLSILFVLGSIWVIFVGGIIPLRADQEIIWDTAKQFIENNYESLLENGYLAMFPYQIGIVSLAEILIRIFGNVAVLIIRMLNVISITAIAYYIYKITDILFKNEDTNKLVLILTLAFTPIILMTTFVYANLIGMAFGVMAIYYALLWLKNKSWKEAIILAITISLAIILKSNYKIYLVGIVILLLLELFKKINLKVIAVLALIIILPAILQSSLKLVTQVRSNTKMQEGIPMVSFVYMGLNIGTNGRTYGWYNGVTRYIYYTNGYDTEASKNQSIKLIKDRAKYFFENPEYTINFFSQKFASTWCEPTYQSIWANAPLDKYEEVEQIDNNQMLISMYNGSLNVILTKYLDILQVLIYLLSAIYLIKNINSSNINTAILAIIFFGGVCFHLIWETKSLYVLMYVILLLPYTAEQMRKLINKEK